MVGVVDKNSLNIGPKLFSSLVTKRGKRDIVRVGVVVAGMGLMTR